MDSICHSAPICGCPPASPGFAQMDAEVEVRQPVRLRVGDVDSRVVLTRAGGLRPLLDQLGEIGAPTGQMLGLAGLSPELVDDPNTFIPLHQVHRFVEIAAATQGLDDLGARVACRVSAFDLELLGPALRRAVTVYDYLQTGIQLIGQLTRAERFWLTLEQGHVRFHHEAPGRACLGRQHEDVYCLAVTVRMLRQFLGPDWHPVEVDLLASGARILGDHGVFGDAALRLAQPHSSFVMPFEVLQQRIPGRTGGMRVLEGCATRIDPAMPATFVESVEAVIESLLLAGALRIETLAESATMSPRTLQRRLYESGVSYSDLVHRTRIRLASDWLTQTTLTVGEISAILGYSDPANFTRAFRHTTGISPQGFRRGL